MRVHGRLVYKTVTAAKRTPMEVRVGFIHTNALYYPLTMQIDC